MNSGMATTRACEPVPDIGASVPAAALHVVFLAVATVLCALVLASPFWIAVGLSLAIAAILLPKLVPAWWLLLLLALSQLWREPRVTDVAFYLLLAGVHLLHLLDGLARLLPWDGRVQVVAIRRPLRRFVLMQAVVQAVAVGALFAARGGPGTVPGLSILAALVLGLLAVVLVRSLRQAESRG